MPSSSNVAILAKICSNAGRLADVAYALFSGDSRFVTAIRLTFETYSVVVRAVPDDDTVALAEGDLVLEVDEVLSPSNQVVPWPAYIGRKVDWASSIMNQQGYRDAVRLEFSGERSGVEFVANASAIKLYEVKQVT